MHLVAVRGQELLGHPPRARPERGAKAFVVELMQVDEFANLRILRLRRIAFDAFERQLEILHPRRKHIAENPFCFRDVECCSLLLALHERLISLARCLDLIVDARAVA